MTLAMQGSYQSDDGRTSFDWAMPDWSALDHKLCGLGLHIASRKRVVSGWVGYFSKVDHYYCACGARRWMWYERGFVDEEKVEPGSHLRWIEGHIEMERTFAEHREWESRR